MGPESQTEHKAMWYPEPTARDDLHKLCVGAWPNAGLLTHSEHTGNLGLSPRYRFGIHRSETARDSTLLTNLQVIPAILAHESHLENSFVGHQVFILPRCLYNLLTLVGKQPQAIYKGMDETVWQSNFTNTDL